MDGKHILKNNSELNDYLATATMAFLAAVGVDIGKNMEDIEKYLNNVKFFAEEYRCLVTEGKTKQVIDRKIIDGEATVAERRKELIENIKATKKAMGVIDLGCDYE